MTQLKALPAADEPEGFRVSFAEVQALGAGEQVDLFQRAHRHAVWSRYAEVVALTAIDASRAYESFGCSSILQFGAKVADYTDHMVWDMLRIGRALRDCPELDAAFRSERLSWSKVRALVPVVTNENAAKWIDQASRASTAQLERTVAKQREPTGRPGMAPMPEVAIGVLVAFRELCARVRQRLGKPGMPDGECAGVLFAIAGWAFDQHAEEALAASGYSDADPCAEALGTEAATPHAGSEPVSAPQMPHADRELSSSPTTSHLAAPSCDEAVRSPHSRHIPEALRRFVLARANYRCEAPGCSNSQALDLHHLKLFAHGGTHTAANLDVWCRPCHELWHRSVGTDPDEL